LGFLFYKGLKIKEMKTVNYRKISRELAIKQGAYDGRFTTKIVTNKKKEASKKACRKKVQY
jgi:hypothetical protein